MTTVQFPEALQFLFEPAPYKVAYGGRGSGKSWGFARAALLEGARMPLRWGYAREIMNSIKESAHALLCDQIRLLGLEAFYDIQERVIRGRNGTEFLFFGLRHNVDKIKSVEGLDRVTVMEARNVSRSSWNTLLPTVRKAGAEIWVEFNPELDTDETYQRFVLRPPTGAIVRKIGWQQNPWFPETLERQRRDMERDDPDLYLNIWEGHTRQMLDGAVYAKELRAATEEDRITRVPYDRTKPVHTFWDLGWADATSIWFAQAVGLEYRVLDFLEVSQTAIPDILREMQGRGYVYGTDYLPHDADSATLGSNGRTIAQMLRAAGRTVIVLPRRDVAEGINAARTIFPSLWFDEARCADGLNHLRHYRYDVDPDTRMFSRKPLHDEHSHAADAFRGLAMSLSAPKAKPRAVRPVVRVPVQSSVGWMG